MSSESGFELGAPRTLHYALVPHKGDWRDAAIFRDGLEFNHPLLVRKAGIHAGRLPARWGMVEISSANVVLTALKPGPAGSTIIRVYEASGRATPDARIKVNAGVKTAEESDLLERAGSKLKTENGTLHFSLHPFEIKTIKLQLGATKSGR